MDAKEFYKRFVTLMREDRVLADGRSLLQIYKTDEPEFTKIVNHRIVPQIITESGLVSQNEYFRVDTVGWTTKFEDIDAAYSKSLGLVRHLWDLKIAVEHENDKSNWTDELIKIAHLRCPLKVVIGYAHCDERGNVEDEKLKFAYSCLSRLDAFDIHANEEFLIVLGNGAPRKRANGTYDKFDYRGYVLTQGKAEFVKLEIGRL